MILSPNKIQEGDVLNFIKEGYSLRLGEKTTVVCDTTLTGFDTVGIAACVNPSTYDHDMGCGVARRDIKDKIWGHLGFVLQWAIKHINIFLINRKMLKTVANKRDKWACNLLPHRVSEARRAELSMLQL